ncbi:MAG: hypothetical protein MUF87_14310 [Anaerolineae bacterium]|jgi:hypothetical protein|nr:hypothetical protein [Anaerolineae bacterium]
MKQLAPIEQTGDQHPFALKLTLPDAVLALATVGFLVVGVIALWLEGGRPDNYSLLRWLHFQLSRYGLVMGVVMLIAAVYIGILRKGDVTPWFRRGTYVILLSMIVQALLGATMMYGYGVPAGKPEHLIYGIGTVLALPFFIYVEVTAPKRPSMGSYIWGFALFTGVIIRAISTGPIGG